MGVPPSCIRAVTEYRATRLCARPPVRLCACYATASFAADSAPRIFAT